MQKEYKTSYGITKSLIEAGRWRGEGMKQERGGPRGDAHVLLTLSPRLPQCFLDFMSESLGRNNLVPAMACFSCPPESRRNTQPCRLIIFSCVLIRKFLQPEQMIPPPPPPFLTWRVLIHYLKKSLLLLNPCISHLLTFLVRGCWFVSDK